MLRIEREVSGAPDLAVLTHGGRRVSHWHGITLNARCLTLPCSVAARRSTVSLVPRGGTPGVWPA